MEFKEFVLKKSIYALSQENNGELRYQGMVCVPDVNEVTRLTFEVAYGS